MSPREQVYTISDEDVLDPIETPGLNTKKIQISRRPERREKASDRSHYMAVRNNPRALMASTLSLFCFGAGQIYNRQFKLGVLLLLTEILGIVCHWSAVATWRSIRETALLFGIAERELVLAAAGADLLLVLLALLGIHQAYRRAESDAGAFDGLANPALSGLASLLIPGWGQLFNGQLGKALCFTFSLLIVAYVTAFAIFTPILTLEDLAAIPQSLRTPNAVGGAAMLALGSLWVLSVYDAILVAGFQRRLA